MELHDLQKQIVQGTLDNIYIFTGEEVGIMDVYIDRLQQVTGSTKIRLDAVQDVYSSITKRRITNDARCYIVRDDKEYMQNEKAWPRVRDLVSGSPHFLILVFTTLDKRSKFYKRNKEDIVEFAKLSSKILAGYVQKELPGITTREATQLAEICECDYSRILMECDKVRHYAHAAHGQQGLEAVGTSTAEYNYSEAFNTLVSQGIIFQPIGDITFKLTDSILTRNFPNASRYLSQARRKQEPTILVLSVLYNGFKQILMVQGLGPDRRDVVKRTGLTAWQVRMATDKKGYYTIPELVDALKVIRYVEKGIKTGQIDDDISLEYVIANIM